PANKQALNVAPEGPLSKTGAAGPLGVAINQEFLELKSFLCAQMIDEARHVEVCRKRALVSGEGLGQASVAAEQALKEILSAETYPEASVATNLLLGSFVLAMYRGLATLAESRADRLL